jgi:uncharacterized LabA/DUF88 family protein
MTIGKMQDSSLNNIALFIDADNAPASKIQIVLSELATYGVVTIRRAYGNWKNPALKSWEEILHEASIQPIQQFDLTKGKNATDIALTIDVMDTIYSKNVSIFCFMSSDCDFTPLVTRVVSEGKMVIGFGESKTPSAFANACSKFLDLNKVGDKKIGSDSESMKQDTNLINLLRQAINASEEEDGWASLARVGSHISNHSSFDQRNYGFKKLSDMFGKIDLFEVKKISGQLMVRDRRRKSV